MIHFRRAEALNPIIPVHYKELCNKLISFDELHSKLRSTGQKDVSDLDLKALENYHDQLLVLARSVLAPDREPQLVERANIAFAMGVLALHHYSKTVEGTLPMVDTVGSKTLQAFQIDWDPSAIDESRLREVLESALR
jgi:hypothetical protein